jgi:acyl transferase domain-containing protein/acyl carrier protein
VLSGDRTALTAVVEAFQASGGKATWLRVSHAFHSPLMDPALDELRAAAAKIVPGEPTITVVSDLTGKPAVPGELADPEYWVRHARGTTRFRDGVRSLADLGCTRLQELGPGGDLSSLAAGCLVGVTVSAPVPSMRAQRPEVETLLAAVARLHTSGQAVDWAAVFAGRGAQRISLPTYAFQRERYWLQAVASASTDVRVAGLDPAGHPLLGAMVELPDDHGVVLSGRLALDTQPWLADHRVAGTVLVPGTALLSMAEWGARKAGCEVIEELVLEAPLAVPDGTELQVRVFVSAGTVSVHARSEDGDWTRHAHGTVTQGSAEPSADLRTWPPQGAEPVSVTPERLYADLAAQGLEYGPAFRDVRAMWRRGAETFAEVALSGGGLRPADYLVHPALLDAALHPISLGMDGAVLPYVWAGVQTFGTAGSRLRVRIAPAGPHAVSVEAADADGNPVIAIRSLTLRPRPDEWASTQDGPDGLLIPSWALVPDLPTPAAAGRWALLASPGDDLADVLRDTGIAVDVHDELADVAVPQWILLACPAVSQANADAVRTQLNRLLAVAAAFTADDRFADTRLAVLTRDAVAVDGEQHPAGLAHRAVWGFMRALQAEHPGRFVLLDEDGDPASRRAIPAALATGEPQLALRCGAAHRPTLTEAESAGTVLAQPTGEQHWRLDFVGKQTFEALDLVAWPEAGRALAPGEVRVRMRAAGLNFRDVLLALGVIPPSVDADATSTGQGGEGAGIVVEVGPAVVGLQPGDRVMGLFSGIGPVSITDHRLVARVPHGWSFEQAAAVPVAFLTAYYGLVDLAGLGAGESVLVHAGTGGVGTAAVQLARHLGADVFATASPAKWPALQAAGVADDHIASSRTLDFEQYFLATTGNRGVDVVLNSLAGDFIDASLRLLPRGGRFLEMGKTERRDSDAVAAAHAAVTYRAYDVRDPGPDRIQEMLIALVTLFDTGALEPPRVLAWDIRRAPHAFRYLSEARHTGKIVLTLPPGDEVWDPARAVLITGGHGRLGSLVARHLIAEHGIRQVVLMGRKLPAPGSAQARAVEELAELGADVRSIACDAADRAALDAALDELAREGVRLGGVVHSAGVLDDGVLASLTPEKLDRTLRPKVDAALNLHEATRDLSAFVLFSSLAGTLGTAGQAGYAAGNAFLDALVELRRCSGQPGSSIVWGLWQAGMGADLGDGDLARMARMGVLPLSDKQGLDLFDAAMRRNAPTAVAAEWAVGRDLAEPAPEAPAEGPTVLDIVCQEMAVVLGHASSRTVDPREPFDRIGLDSLAAVELRNRIATATGVRLPATFIYDWPTPAHLAKHLGAPAGPASEDGTA